MSFRPHIESETPDKQGANETRFLKVKSEEVREKLDPSF
jgi:hypothetical protein